MLPKTVKGFPNGRSALTESEYIRQISSALREELGTTRAASKTIQRWTGASDHTARNWINGVTGPNGHYLAALTYHSDSVLTAFVQMSGRHELLLPIDVHAAEVALAKAVGALEVLKRQRLSLDRFQRDM